MRRASSLFPWIVGRARTAQPVPSSTFRPAERGLAPERQLAFVFRAERTTAAYAFPQPNA